MKILAEAYQSTWLVPVVVFPVPTVHIVEVKCEYKHVKQIFTGAI